MRKQMDAYNKALLREFTTKFAFRLIKKFNVWGFIRVMRLEYVREL